MKDCGITVVECSSNKEVLNTINQFPCILNTNLEQMQIKIVSVMEREEEKEFCEEAGI